MDGREAMPERTAGKSSIFCTSFSASGAAQIWGDNAKRQEIGKVGQLAG